MNIHEGSRIRLATPGNDRLDGATAFVSSLEPWGARVLTEAAATGRFRAAWQEMIPWQEANVHQHVAVTVSQVKFAWDSSYTGDACSTCGTMKLRRAGTCLCCDNCGSTTGCS